MDKLMDNLMLLLWIAGVIYLVYLAGSWLYRKLRSGGKPTKGQTGSGAPGARGAAGAGDKRN